MKLLAKVTAQLLWLILLCLFQITSGISNPFLLTKLSVLVFHIFVTRCGSLWLMLGVAIACDDFQVAGLMNQDECEKQRNYGLSVVKCHLMVSPPPFKKIVVLFFGDSVLCNIQTERTSHLHCGSCLPGMQYVAIILIRNYPLLCGKMFIIGSDFDPDVTSSLNMMMFRTKL